ncbi:connector enhancer of kinase suppressor of ras 2, partial [Elysia marginata]
LDDAVHQYIPNFIQGELCGKKLLMLSHSDLEKLGVNKLGHQELILEGVDLLKSLRYTFETENLQHLALQLSCKAKSLHNEIQARSGENDPNRANVQSGRSRRQLSVSVLSAVCDIQSTMKTLTSWLDRAPFETIHGISLLRNSLVKLGLELVTVAQNESGVVEVENAIMKTCQGMTEYCDELVINMKESLVVQPASLELATIRKKQGEELGMNIQSSYYGIHAIGCIKDMSPADLCSKIEKGDEVLQVNNQTVLGWQLAKLVAALREKPKEVVMLLKKRPRHTTPFGNVPNKRLNASRHVPSVATLPKSVKKRRSKDGEKPPRPTLQEYVTSSVPTGDIYITKESPEDPMDGNDTDNDVFRSGSESPQFTLPVISDPKQRRATVSGGSPTFERSSLVADDLDTSTAKGHGLSGIGQGHSLDPPPTQQRPRSQAINAQEKEAAIAALLAGGADIGGGLSLLPPSKREEGKSPPVLVREKKHSVSDSEELSSTATLGNSSLSDVLDSEPSSSATVGNSSATDVLDCELGGQQESDTTIPPQPPEIEMPHKTVENSVVKGVGDTSEATSANVTKTIEPHAENSAQAAIQAVSVNDQREIKPLEAHTTVSKGDGLSAESSSQQQSTHSGPSNSGPVEDPGQVQDFTIQKPTPVLRQNALGWNRTKIISTEVAGSGNTGKNDVPLLKRIKRLDSTGAPEGDPKMEDDDVFDKPQKKVGFSDESQSSGKDLSESFTHIVVGGVVQKIPVEKSKVPSSNSESPTVKMRNKTGNKTKLDRRVSCKDLGRGDCEGWLYKRKQKDRTLSKHWDKRWCVLKKHVLYYYKQKDALKADGLIHLPAFQVSPATNLKTKKHAFKIHNSGTTFYFASERQEDMSKWMNKLGLAAIKFDTEGRDVAMGGFSRPDKLTSSSSTGTRTADYSESEDEADEATRDKDKDKWQGSAMSLASMSSLGSSSGSLGGNSSPLVKRHRLKDVQESVGASTEELHAMLRSIQTNDLTIDGKDKVRHRQSQCTATSDLQGLPNQQEVERMKKLHSLQRTLRDKERQLQIMDNLIENPVAIRDIKDKDFVDLSGSLNKSNSASLDSDKPRTNNGGSK